MYNHQRPQEQQQTITGLARYRSAPSSYFALLNRSDSSSHGGLMEAEDFEQIFNLRASSPETHRIFSRFMNSSDNIQEQQQSQSQSQPQSNSSFLPPRKETESNQLQRKRSRDYSTVSQTMYQNHSSEVVNSAMDNSYNRLLGPISSNRVVPIKMEGGGGSNLIRHCSSPAGLFASMNIENGIILGENGPGDASFDDDRADYNEYIQGRFSINSWDDSEIMSDNFLNANKAVNTSDDQNTEIRDRPATLLSHHLSLPKRSSEISAMEKLLQDSVPCRIRAKRGCATHPRSIAERVRRTKISERMRKLQELVPNMEKQTNTSDMLDLAVDYIKDLQTQVKTLSINRAKCTCLA